MQPMNPKVPPGVGMPDSHIASLPKASNHRGTGSRCSHEFGCLILIVLIGPRPTIGVGIGGCWGPLSLLAASSGSLVAYLLPPLWLEALGVNVLISKPFRSIKINISRLASSYIGASGGFLGLVDSIGLLPFCSWKPWARVNDANQACKLLVASSGSSAASASRPFGFGGSRLMKTMRRQVWR